MNSDGIVIEEKQIALIREEVAHGNALLLLEELEEDEEKER